MLDKIDKQQDHGFALTEVLVSILLLGVVLVAHLGALNMYKYMAAFAKHKAQAIYVAQRTLEEQRRQPFAGLASAALGAVSIDTRGTFNSAADDLMGNAILTVTNIDANRKRLQVEVNWRERSPVGLLTLREYCTTDIANDATLK